MFETVAPLGDYLRRLLRPPHLSVVKPNSLQGTSLPVRKVVSKFK